MRSRGSMKKYIDAQKLKDAMNIKDDTNGRFDIMTALQCVDDAPTEEVQEVRHGHWIKFKIPDGVYEHMKCSNCSFYWSMSQQSNIFLRCPHCGALMDEEE